MTLSRDSQRLPEVLRAERPPIVPSSSLVPADDPTLLFTNAGMNQFKDLFLGREKRDYTRATTSQKCMRVSGKHNDLDNVGPSLRHHTFFEMLGNFSFGDYFKKDAIPFAWELLTDVWKLPPDRLVVYDLQGRGRHPARRRGVRRSGSSCVPADRILELGADDNFWQMGDTGPCGRCSEIHYFRGDVPCGEAPAVPRTRCSCDRTSRSGTTCSWSSTGSADGTLKPLPAPSIDTGMGLERITAVLQGKLSNYDTDLFMPILDGDRRARRARATATHRRAVRRLDARRRRSHPRDDVPDRRRRRPVERMARLRAAQDHAARDAARQAPRLHRAVPARARRRRSIARWATPIRSCGATATTIEQTILAEEAPVRRGADRGAAAARSGDRQGARRRSRSVLPGDGGVPALRHVRRAATTSSRTPPATQGVAVDRDGFERAMEGQREQGARRQRVRRRRRARSSRSTPDERALDRRRRSVRGLHDDARRRRAGRRALRRAAAAGRRAGRRRRRAMSRWRRRRSISKPAARCRTRAASSTRRPARRRRSKGWRASAPACRARTACA